MSSDKLGFLLVQQQTSVYCDQLKEAEDEHKRQVEAITRQINKLYQEQKQHEKKEKRIRSKEIFTDEHEEPLHSKQVRG